MPCLPRITWCVLIGPGGCLGWAVAILASTYLSLHIAEASLPPTLMPTPKPTPTLAAPTTEPVGVIRGLEATWYCKPGISQCTKRHPAGGLYAAISPDLDYLRGVDVLVHYQGRSVRVAIIDCNCGATHAIDLYADAFEQLAPLNRGRLKGVTLTFVHQDQ